jgi:hypothetical protein
MEKKIIIIGKNNRYQIKKLLDVEPLNIQIKASNANSISKKLSGYKSQDKRRGWIPDIELNDILELLKTNVCRYCSIKVLVDYETKLHPMQWTLDRIDNNLPHNKDNVVLSCLRCNLEKRKRSVEHFLFPKNIIKI